MIMTSIDNSVTRRTGPSQWLNQVAVNGQTKQPDGFEVQPAQLPSSLPTRYEVLTQVGTGGTGIVYKVRDLETGEIVALKVLKPGIASDQDMQQNLRKELCLARKVTHKNVCRIYEFNRSNDMAFLSMEFVEGENLLSKLRRGGPLSVGESLEIAQQICAGLREAHVQGIVHRDLKPANIMLDVNGVVKIMDFGIARLSQGNVQMTGTIAGTPAYMAPEQIELKPMGPRTDIYSVGLLLYEMITGSPAFDGDTPIALALKQIRELPRRPCEIVPTLPAHTESVIWKCLQKDPAKRFQSVDELYVALEKESRIGDGVPSWVSLEVRLPNVKMHRIVHYSKEKIRGAVSQSAAFAVDIRHITIKAKRVIRHCVEKANALVRAQDLRAVRITHTGPVAATLGVLLLGTVVAVGLGGHTKQAAAAPVVARSLQSAQSSDPRSSFLTVTANRLTVQGPVSLFDTISPADTREAVTTQEVDLSAGPEVASGSKSLSASLEESTLSQETSASIVKKVKAQSGTQTPIPSYTQKNSGPKIRRSVSASVHTQQTPAPPSAAAEIANAVKGQKTVDPRLDLSATVLAASSSDLAPKRTDVGNQQKAEESKTDSTESYLEVGSFKDASWADKAVDQLSRLGFHAVSIHKTHLWMQSYHVQVGPYANPTDIEAAQRSLASQDFKSHLVK